MKTAPCRCRRPGRQSATEPVQLTMVAVSSSCPAFGHVTRWSPGLAHPVPLTASHPRPSSMSARASAARSDSRISDISRALSACSSPMAASIASMAVFAARRTSGWGRVSTRHSQLERRVQRPELPAQGVCGAHRRPPTVDALWTLARRTGCPEPVPPDPGRPSWPGITGLTGDGRGPAGTG